MASNEVDLTYNDKEVLASLDSGNDEECLDSVSRKWKCSQPVRINNEIPLTFYDSNRSRLSVAVAQTPGPLVKGLIVFVTEALDDDGLPHTLEHLTFMGSEKYPYKGVLDLVANQCLASGTNAFTDQDHTGYELTTVGSQGFFKILPMYLDHLLSPSLTDAQFVTEVHHINGEGEDVGVVYSEMQECESEMHNIVSRKRKELFYPECNPYRVETGGRLAALRTTCNMNKIRRYHHDFYHISNMFVIVCGSIDHCILLEILSTVEERSQQRVPHLFNRPFMNEMLVYEDSIEEKIICPNEDEKFGMVEIAWKGPKKNLDDLIRLEVLANYLCNTAASPLQQDFVQLDEQLASSVNLYIREQVISEIVLNFTGVPMESASHKYVFKLLCMHKIYGTTKNLNKRLNGIDYLRDLINNEREEWIKLSHNYLRKECVTVLGYPSRKEMARITDTEEKRIQKQRRKLGENGLRQCALELENAIRETTEQKPSPELLSKMMIRDLEAFAVFKVETIDVQTARNYEGLFKLGLPIYIHNIETHFVQFMAVWDTKDIPLDLRMWMMIYFELIFQSPAVVEGKKLSYEDVSKLYTRDLTSVCASLGVLGRFERFCSVVLKAVPERYVTMTSWLTIFIKDIIFEAKRVKVTAQSLIALADEEKRDGYEMQDTLLQTALYQKNSNSYIHGSIQLEEFHKTVLNLTEKNPSFVIRKLEELREALINSPVNIHIICSVDKVMPFLPTTLSWLYNHRAKTYTEFYNSPGENIRDDSFGKQRVVAVGATESSFLKQCVRFSHERDSQEGLNMMLMVQYLSQVEGTLYKAIRGGGIAYGVGIDVDFDESTLNFWIYRSAQLEQAYETAKGVVMKEMVNVNEIEFEAAKRSLVSEIMQCEDTVTRAAHRAVLNQFEKLSSQFWREFCERIWRASVEDVVQCSKGYIIDLFKDKKCCRAISVPYGKVKDIRKYFQGIEVVRSSELHAKFDL
ncbi:unnamed protein product [Thelazia callipaeda]|uniref:Zinc metalloprotease n=1 Tax=Thelazia callipaeda TaxID=103827 RepID=A0A0N5CYM4_THECL|nr:unnamed protein product [Thelazia callipaeda]